MCKSELATVKTKVLDRIALGWAMPTENCFFPRLVKKSFSWSQRDASALNHDRSLTKVRTSECLCLPWSRWEDMLYHGSVEAQNSVFLKHNKPMSLQICEVLWPSQFNQWFAVFMLIQILVLIGAWPWVSSSVWEKVTCLMVNKEQKNRFTVFTFKKMVWSNSEAILIMTVQHLRSVRSFVFCF